MKALKGAKPSFIKRCPSNLSFLFLVAFAKNHLSWRIKANIRIPTDCVEGRRNVNGLGCHGRESGRRQSWRQAPNGSWQRNGGHESRRGIGGCYALPGEVQAMSERYRSKQMESLL